MRPYLLYSSSGQPLPPRHSDETMSLSLHKVTSGHWGFPLTIDETYEDPSATPAGGNAFRSFQTCASFVCEQFGEASRGAELICRRSYIQIFLTFSVRARGTRIVTVMIPATRARANCLQLSIILSFLLFLTNGASYLSKRTCFASSLVTL